MSLIALAESSQAKQVIALSVIDQCNKEMLPDEDAYWARFANLYNQRVPGEQGENMAILIAMFLKADKEAA